MMTEKETTNPKPLCLTEYLDYRSYLKDLYEFQRQTKASYSLRSLARRAGFKSAMSIKNIIDKKQHVAEDKVEALIKAFNIQSADHEYFKLLVQFNRCKNEVLAHEYYQKLLEIQNNSIFIRYLESDKDLKIFSYWYIPSIMELFYCKNFQNDPAWICDQFNGRITIEEAKFALNYISEMGLHDEAARGLIKTPDQIKSSVLSQYHLKMNRMFVEAIEHQSSQEREVGGVTISLTEEKIEIARQMIREFKNKLHRTLSSTEKADKVVHFTFGMMPTTKNCSEGITEKENKNEPKKPVHDPKKFQ